MSEKYCHTRAALRDECGFSEADFKTLWKHVKADLNDPKNIIGLEGPKKHRSAWNIWVGEYINGGLASQYWGEGNKRKWALNEDSEEILEFMFFFLKHVAQVNRTAVKIKRESIASSSRVSNLTEREDSSADLTTPLAARSTKRKVDNTPDSLNDTVEEEEEEDVEDQTDTVSPSNKRPKRRSGRLYHSKSSSVRITAPNTSMVEIGPPPGPIYLKPNIGVNASISPTKNTSSPIYIRAKSVPQVSRLSEHVFETKIAGTNQFRIIYAAQTPTLALFISKVYEKCALAPQQQIKGIDVWIGDEFITIDLEEKDWAYIINCVVNDSTRTKVVVEVS